MKINGTRVVDSKRTLLLHVLPKDVKSAKTKDPGSCAAAAACLRQFNAEAARVHIGRTYIKLKKRWLRFMTPRSLRSEIIAFDRGGSFEPGTYRLNPVPETQRLGVQKGTKTNQNKKTKRLRPKPHMVLDVRHHLAR